MGYYYGWQIMLMIMSVILAFISVLFALGFLIYLIIKKVYLKWKNQK